MEVQDKSKTKEKNKHFIDYVWRTEFFTAFPLIKFDSNYQTNDTFIILNYSELLIFGSLLN